MLDAVPITEADMSYDWMVSETGGSGIVITPIPSWAGDPEPLKNHWRPPDYNAENYVSGLVSRRVGSPPSPPAMEEMSLRQFSTVSDLLTKLAVDLRAAYPSFVQEFVSPGLDGCSQLLETLRWTQTSQSSRRQGMLDELACLQCLSYCFRCPETGLRMAQSPAGLFGLAASIMSNLNKSRILALQILRKICEEAEEKGFGPVSDAMSTMRLRFGEPVRFKFLCGMLSSATPDLLHAGLGFINSFLESAPETQMRLYIQAELAQAGFDPDLISKNISDKAACSDLIKSELNRWSWLHVDITKLKSREGELVKEVHHLKDRVKILERKLQMLQEEKSQVTRSESRLKSKCMELEREVSSLRGAPGASTPAEDEGISSSGQDDGTEREPLIYEMYTVNNVLDSKPKQEEETTIDEVIEELQNIINDAEIDIKDKKDIKKEREEAVLAKYYTKFLQRSSSDISTNQIENSETEIVPVKLVPYPPRKSRSLFFEREYNNNDLFFEEESDNSDSLLSISNDPSQYIDRKPKPQVPITHREAHKSYVRRRETFHNGLSKEEPVIEIKPEIKNRRGSLDGVFCYNEVDSYTKSTRIYIDGNESVGKRLKSKSLDRIREGLDTMVDIVVTNGIEEQPLIKPIPVQRNGLPNSYSMTSSKQSDDSIRYTSDRAVFLPIKSEPSPTSTQTFLLKRGHLNAGMYSGQLNLKDTPSVTTTINISDYYNKSLTGLNLSVTGKLSDLPSGLY
nr:uncharacterized protein LOC106688491 [Halyomorpha halys]